MTGIPILISQKYGLFTLSSLFTKICVNDSKVHFTILMKRNLGELKKTIIPRIIPRINILLKWTKMNSNDPILRDYILKSHLERVKLMKNTRTPILYVDIVTLQERSTGRRGGRSLEYSDFWFLIGISLRFLTRDLPLGPPLTPILDCTFIIILGQPKRLDPLDPIPLGAITELHTERLTISMTTGYLTR